MPAWPTYRRRPTQFEHVIRLFDRARSRRALDAAGMRADKRWEVWSEEQRLEVLAAWEKAAQRLGVLPAPVSQPVNDVRITVHERGQALIEFILIFPVLLIVLYGALEVGLAISRHETLAHATREGAVMAAGGASVSAVADYVQQEIGDSAAVAVCYADTNTDGTVGNNGDTVEVDVVYDYHFAVGSGAFWSPPPVSMKPAATAVMQATQNDPTPEVCPS